MSNNIKLFYKYEGSGNDFIVFDQMKEEFDLEKEVIQKLCNRRFGIGGDGLMFLRSSDSESFRMVYYNADGKEGSMCGNGGRCISHLYSKLYGKGTSSFQFNAIDGIHEVNIVSNEIISLGMSDVSGILSQAECFVLDTGSPHFIKMVDDIDALDVYNEGRKIRYSERFKKEGINVNFMQKDGNAFKIRTYERGVEDETYSCGTGAVACAITAYLLGLTNGNNVVDLITKGGPLQVSFVEKKGKFIHIFLNGAVSLTFKGEVNTQTITS